MRPALALSAVSLLAACATPSDRYPSLGIRDVERAQGRFDPAPAAPLAVPTVEIPAGAPLPARLAAIGAEAEAAHRAFLSDSVTARRLADSAAGAAVGAPGWASAQVALASLDSARSRTAVALADLDTLMVAEAVQANDLTAIEAVRQQVLSLVAEEDGTLARLRAKIR